MGAYDKSHTHECQDRAMIIGEMWERLIVEGACSSKFPDVEAAASKVAEAIGDFYQLIGQKLE